MVLKTLDAIGNFQRPVFSLGVSQHMHKITNLNRSRSFETKMYEKNTLVTRSRVLSDA